VRTKPGWMTMIGAGAFGIVLISGPAHAALIWDGDASRGMGVWGNSNCSSPGRVDTTTDPAHGLVWRFHKPASSSRCEQHNIRVDGNVYRFQNDSTYYLGWSMKLSSTTNNNANFQWKSYGHHIQNYPLVLKMINGRLTLLNRQPGGRDHLPWAAPVKAGEWNQIVLGIHTSSATTGGWAEVYFNGVQQTFSNGQKRWPCRTWDDRNDPKWGVYGARGTTVDNFVDGLKVGTTYADVS
jgi:Polysaccharide lyase